MLRKLSFLLNAAMVAFTGALAAHVMVPHEVTALAGKLLAPALIASLTPSLHSPAAPPTAGASKTSLPLPLAQSSAQANAPAPSATSGSTTRPVTGAIVPPIVRRRPGSGQGSGQASGQGNGSAVADATPAKRPAPALTAKADKAKSTPITTRTVRTAAVAPSTTASRKPIDLSGRSALGAAPAGVKCNTGLKYDAKLMKCVLVAPKAAAHPKPVKIVKAVPSTGSAAPVPASPAPTSPKP